MENTTILGNKAWISVVDDQRIDANPKRFLRLLTASTSLPVNIPSTANGSSVKIPTMTPYIAYNSGIAVCNSYFSFPNFSTPVPTYGYE